MLCIFNIRFSIGDFGIASSSLLYLGSARFSQIKMDPALTMLNVDRLAHSAKVEILVNISEELDIDLIADEVYSTQQVVLLKQHNVNLITGAVCKL